MSAKIEKDASKILMLLNLDVQRQLQPNQGFGPV